MATRKTPEEMELAERIRLARLLVRYKHSRAANYELNDLLADMTDSHNLELATGGLKQISPGSIEKVISDLADTDDVNRGVPDD